MLQNFLQDINDGVIPNIENAYNQVIKFENERLLTQSAAMYESYMNEELLGKLPVDSYTLNDLHKQKKLKVVEKFRQS
jgi:hypothetical protein